MKTSMHSTTWFPIKKCVVLSLILLTSIAGFIGCTKLQGPVTPSEESATVPDNHLTVYLGESDLITVNGNQSTLTDFDRTLKKIPDKHFKKLIIEMTVHPDANYGLVTDVEQIMRERGTLRINYITAAGN